LVHPHGALEADRVVSKLKVTLATVGESRDYLKRLSEVNYISVSRFDAVKVYSNLAHLLPSR
jgi:hypothetical protein